MYNQFFTIKPRISEKNGGSKVVHLIVELDFSNFIILLYVRKISHRIKLNIIDLNLNKINLNNVSL